MNIQILQRLKPETFLIFDQNYEKIRLNPLEKQWRKTKSKNNNLLLRENLDKLNKNSSGYYHNRYYHIYVLPLWEDKHGEIECLGGSRVDLNYELVSAESLAVYLCLLGWKCKIWLFIMPLEQVVVTETLTVHAFLMTRNGIGRKEKERKSTRPPPVSALTASSFSQFQTSVTRNFSSCLLSETIPAIAFSSLGTFPEWMHLFDWCRTSSAKCWNRAKVDFGLCIWGEGRGVGWGRGGGPIRDLVSHSMQLPLPTVQYCSQPLKKNSFQRLA